MTEEKTETQTVTKSSGLKRDKKCSNCGRVYGMKYALDRHMKICLEKGKAMEKHPERYVGKLRV